ncbi:DUF393 domain-containing protein [Verrucomicrobiaceae bacterium R5-34]|nr:DUF393 domain-containing protein [Verrucomicrobiaceae bacterium R5-34]
MTDPKLQASPILFLDGDCVFCQKSATLLHRWDRYDRLHFAPLQGETAELLPQAWRQLTDENQQASGAAVLTEHYGTNKQTHWRGADAILRALYHCGGISKLFWLLHFLPQWLKSPSYRWVARHRHRLTSGQPHCLIPDESFRKKMLP